MSDSTAGWPDDQFCKNGVSQVILIGHYESTLFYLGRLSHVYLLIWTGVRWLSHFFSLNDYLRNWGKLLREILIGCTVAFNNISLLMHSFYGSEIVQQKILTLFMLGSFFRAAGSAWVLVLLRCKCRKVHQKLHHAVFQGPVLPFNVSSPWIQHHRMG